MRPATVLLTSRRKVRLPGSLSLYQDRMLRRRHIELTRAATPFRGELYASHSDIATHMPKKLYFTFHVPGPEGAVDRVWRRKIQGVQEYFPAYRLQRLGEILHDLRAYEIPLTYHMASDMVDVLAGMEEHIDAATRPSFEKLRDAITLRHQKLGEEHSRTEARKERRRQSAIAAASAGTPPAVAAEANVPTPPTWKERVMALPREVQLACQQLWERFRS
eukprot:GGOE01065155.1.p1 GENE.GGOE01065155.1~~GGOE01065155.1.p1  ORF type:complete len:219 (+),score=56.06 GGOE01065155.1:70-726(+)